MTTQFDLNGFLVPYTCHKCTRAFSDMAEVVKHSKSHHVKNYKKCSARKCPNMILNKCRNKFCFTHLNELAQTNHKLFEIPLKTVIEKCQSCSIPLTGHTKEMVWQCVGKIAEKMLACVPLEVIKR